MSRILLRGLRAGNLQHLDLELAQGHWTAVHGPSGAGKSALLFRVLEPIARQRFRILEDPRALPGTEEDWLPRVADAVEGLQPVLAAAGEIPRARRRVEVGTALDLWPALQRAFLAEGQRRCPACGHRWRDWTAAAIIAGLRTAGEGARLQLFSACDGEASAELLAAGWTRVRLGAAGLARLEEAPATLPAEAWLLLDRVKWRPEHEARLYEAAVEAEGRGRAVLVEQDDAAQSWPAPGRCPECATPVPQRAPEELLELRVAEDLELAGRSWTAWAEAPLGDWRELPAAIGFAAQRRLEYLHRTRMGHLAATRTLGTLSLGEGRRLELVTLLAQVRRGQLALFDEPGMGLHGSERRALAGLLRELVDQGNTVLTADPAREFLEAADHWLLLGPGGGPDGGRVVGQGPRETLPAPDDEGAPLEPGRLPVEADTPHLIFRELKTRFLEIDELSLPLGRLVAVVGVSGSGKSTLLEDELVPRLRAEEGYAGAVPLGGVRVLLERALGSSAFSTVATLSGAWGEIRAAFADGEEARMRGLQPADLVARVGQGACERCRGHGVDEARQPCPVCEGLGLREDLLGLRLRHRSLRAWLTTPLERLEKRLPRDGRLHTLVRHLIQVGLGQRTFGERGRHLSLGERGRIALARALASARRDRPQLFLLDEPCLGLPFREARRVVALLHELCAQGHGFWVAEHHEVLLRGADHVIELGPGPGPAGGQLLYAGAPAGLTTADTPTGQWLRSRAAPAPPPAPRSPQPPVRGEVLDERADRRGRQALEAALARELATRSPLLRDQAGGDAEATAAEAQIAALPPTAWPVDEVPGSRLGELLGLTPTVTRLIQSHGEPACALCGGAGPWDSLDQALLAGAADAAPRGVLDFSLAPQLPEGAQGAEPAFLLAAGFRRVWRAGERQSLRAGQAWNPADAVWLDRFDPAEERRSGRIQDLERHARLLADGALDAHADGRDWHFQAGACRDCGAREAGWRHQLGGRDLAEWLALPLAELLAGLAACLPAEPRLVRASALLQGLPLTRAAAHSASSALDPISRRLARLLGWMIAPLEGVVLLHDQPLAELPPPVAARLAAALQDPAHGLHRWTDAEGYAAGPRPLPAPAWACEPFAIGLDLEAAAVPPRATGGDTLREALALAEPLRAHYLRTAEARLRGWGRAELGSGAQAKRCPVCRGAGGPSPHPELRLRCRACRGSGWSRETAVLEDRGLRWPDLGQTSLAELAAHFAATPRLARVLDLMVASGWGRCLLDERLARLPRGLRAWAPILADLAAGAEPAEQLWTAPAAGWNRLELEAMAFTIEDFASRHAAPVWRENHPAWVLRP